MGVKKSGNVSFQLLQLLQVLPKAKLRLFYLHSLSQQSSSFRHDFLARLQAVHYYKFATVVYRCY